MDDMDHRALLGACGDTFCYGAGGSLAVLLVWLYYSAQIFLFEAELTKAFANRFGSRIVPMENAVLVADKTRGQNKES
jgi:membrane protein